MLRLPFLLSAHCLLAPGQTSVPRGEASNHGEPPWHRLSKRMRAFQKDVASYTTSTVRS